MGGLMSLCFLSFEILRSFSFLNLQNFTLPLLWHLPLSTLSSIKSFFLDEPSLRIGYVYGSSLYIPHSL